MARIILFNVINDTMSIIREKRPSKLLPFRGNFPLLSPGREILFNNAIEGKTYLDECPNWVQQILIKGQRIADIENGFYEFLKNNGIQVTYNSMTGAQKAEEIKRFFNSSILDKEDLVIKDQDDYGKL